MQGTAETLRRGTRARCGWWESPRYIVEPSTPVKMQSLSMLNVRWHGDDPPFLPSLPSFKTLLSDIFGFPAYWALF